MHYLKLFPRRWLVLWLAIYITFLVIDLLAPDSLISNTIKYLGMFLILVYAHKTAPADHLLFLALLFTFLADTILIWTDQFVTGIFLFAFAHFFHITRFTKTNPKFFPHYIFIVLALFCFILIQGAPPIYAIAFVYALSILTNIILSSVWYRANKSNPRALFAALGFLCFYYCDVCVGIQYLAGHNILPLSILNISTFLVWVFYFPSQVLISNSSDTLPTK